MARKALLGYAFIFSVGLLCATTVLEKSSQDYASALIQYRKSAQADANERKVRIEAAYTQVYQGIRTIAGLPSVRRTDRRATNLDVDDRATIQQIYNNLRSTLDVSEVYVVPASFDPGRIDAKTGRPEVPALVFDHVVAYGVSPSQTGSVEPPGRREGGKYQAIHGQLGDFARTMPRIPAGGIDDLPMAGSSEISTRDRSDYAVGALDGERLGLVLSVPFFDTSGRFAGVVSTVLRSDVLRDLLPHRHYALVDATSGFVAASRFEGQQTVGSEFVVRAEVDPSLAYSAVLPLTARGPGAAPLLWVGYPDSEFETSREVTSIKTFRLIGLTGCGFMTLICLTLWGAMRHREKLEAQAQLRDLADAAAEGIVVCDGGKVVAVNASFEQLYGQTREAIVGREVADIVGRTAEALAGPSEVRLETDLEAANGTTTPVEILSRTVTYSGRSHRVLAVRDLSERRRAEEDIRFLAWHDPLTRLQNRASFNARLEEEIGRRRRDTDLLAVMCLDLDRFKEVNDLFGHGAGDHVLRAVAERVTAVIGPDDILARLGGDEFAIVLPNISQPSEAAMLAEKILEVIRFETGIDGQTTVVGASIGIAMFPSDGADRAALVTNADTALYRAKQEGRGTYRFFEAEMGAVLRERRFLEHDLRHAVARGELSIVYQPQAKVDTQEIFGFEALLRWNNPSRGSVSPAVFVPIAEESGLILQIGEWVLRQCCAEATTWERPLVIAVNISPVQLHSGNLVQLVHEVLFQTGLPPHRLELEITETALVRDFDRALSVLRQLKSLGIRIAMDDFGTGYSSLSNLRAFPFDKIKIDRSFVTNVNHNDQAAAIIRAVVGLGRGLDLPVLAEGVETLEELGFLAREDCAEAQGYLIGKPTSIEAFKHLVHPQLTDGRKEPAREVPQVGEAPGDPAAQRKAAVA